MPTISPYIFPGVEIDELDPSVFPFVNNYRNTKTMDQIFRIVQNRFNVSRTDIISTSRKQELVYSRTVICFLFRRLLGMSYKRIGYAIGKRNHATAIHNEKTFIDMYNTSREYRETVEDIAEKLNVNIEKLMNNKFRK